MLLIENGKIAKIAGKISPIRSLPSSRQTQTTMHIPGKPDDGIAVLALIRFCRHDGSFVFPGGSACRSATFLNVSLRSETMRILLDSDYVVMIQ